jgi:hypothetical protein
MTLEKKTFTIILLVALGAAILVSMGFFYKENKGNFFEKIDFLRQKMAPALNETTGFLVISYAVILSIGNVIMKTSPKYLASGGESPEEKTTGFVSWLQSKGLSWLPIFISVTVVSFMTFLPINNKILKIGIISIVLSITLVVSLLFNAIIKLFSPKEEFTDVKEEFGHMVKGKRHEYKIAVGSINHEVDTKTIDYEKVFYRLDNDQEEHKPENGEFHNDVYQYPGSKYNHGISGEIQINNTEFNSTLKIVMEKSEKQVADIYYSELPWGSPGGETTLRKMDITDDGKSSHTVSVEGIPSKLIYFHSFKRGTPIFKSKPTKANTGDTYYKLDDNGIAYIVAADSKGSAIKTLDFTKKEYCVWEKHKDKNLETNPGQCNSIVLWEGNPDKPHDSFNKDLKKPIGVRINIKNMEKFFGFDVDAVKDSVRASYTAYYLLVWGSLLVYGFVNGFQTKSLLLFIIAAAVETLLIAQSHSSLNESDVGDYKQASPTFNYAVAGFSTRIATVVAFLSSILTQVKD